MGIRKLLERLFPGNTTEFDTEVGKIESSNIRAIQYNTQKQVLQVDFKSGSRYHYFKVPESIVRGFRRAGSKGKYLATRVKGKYKYKKIKD